MPYNLPVIKNQPIKRAFEAIGEEAVRKIKENNPNEFNLIDSILRTPVSLAHKIRKYECYGRKDK